MSDPHVHHHSPTMTSHPGDHGDHAAQAGHPDHTGHPDNTEHPDHAGHGDHAGHAGHVERFRRLFWINLLLAVPVVAFSPMFAMILGYSVPDGATWIAPLLGSVMFFWGGWPFLTGAVGELRSRRPGMMLLIGLAISVAFVASWGATLGLLDHALEFWWELALLIVIMLMLVCL